MFSDSLRSGGLCPHMPNKMWQMVRKGLGTATFILLGGAHAVRSAVHGGREGIWGLLGPLIQQIAVTTIHGLCRELIFLGDHHSLLSHDPWLICFHHAEIGVSDPSWLALLCRGLSCHFPVTSVVLVDSQGCQAALCRQMWWVQSQGWMLARVEFSLHIWLGSVAREQPAARVTQLQVFCRYLTWGSLATSQGFQGSLALLRWSSERSFSCDRVSDTSEASRPPSLQVLGVAVGLSVRRAVVPLCTSEGKRLRLKGLGSVGEGGMPFKDLIGIILKQIF